jgi:hypothetical protein
MERSTGADASDGMIPFVAITRAGPEKLADDTPLEHHTRKPPSVRTGRIGKGWSIASQSLIPGI